MKKSVLVLAMLLFMLCSVFANPAKETTSGITVTDQIGRVVEIPAKPERIVSGYYISSSACIAMGMKDNLVAVEAQSSKRPIYKLAAPEIIERPDVGTAKAFNLEACLSVKPDLVILPMKQSAVAESLKELGIPAIVVNPESHEQIIEMFRLIGEAAFRAEEAEILIDKYTSILSLVEERAADVIYKPSVYMCGTGSYLRTAPNNMYQSNLIEQAGGVNAASSIEGSSWKDISYEQLISFNPDIMIVPTNSNANGTPDYSIEDIFSDSQLAEITAVKNKAVYQMPVGFEAWDSPVPSGALGALWMLSILHPEVCSENELKNEVNNFYLELYGFNAGF